MFEYQHTQAGTFLRSIFAGCALVSAAVTLPLSQVDPAYAFIPALVAIVLAICLVLFHSLTVTISRDEIMLRYGIGLIHKRFATADLANATAVQNRWNYGWGIRLTPHGWLFNVSGFDAVEIQLKSGAKYRIGTDEPDKLLGAVHSAINSSH